jgi:pimeloyl-ACP methyl ester carboxylesterase
MPSSVVSFTKRDVEIDGVRAQILEAGSGHPLVYLHTVGTMRGFEELLPLARDRRLIVPIHPGFGASDDDPEIDSVLDYVLHYVALFDELKLVEPLDLVGHSLGGWIASMLAALNGHRIRRLALVAPAGLHAPDHPAIDLFMIPPEQIASYMSALPVSAAAAPTNEMKIARYREMTSMARFAWHRSYEPKLDRWLRRVSSPTLLLWGDDDRMIPVQQAALWAERMSGSVEIATFERAGHALFNDRPDALERLDSFFKS